MKLFFFVPVIFSSTYNKRVVTLEILERSQRTRPRKWIRNMGWIFIFPLLLISLLLLNQFWADSPITSWLNETIISLGTSSYPLYNLMTFLFLPAAAWVLAIPVIIMSQCMGSYRHPYLFLSIPGVIVVFAWPLLMAFVYLVTFVPSIASAIGRFLPADILSLLININGYVAIGYSIFLVLMCFLAIIYNVNYPAKYEEIYAKRKKRLLSYDDLDKRAEYKQRFYDDYKHGNFISMMYDLHFDVLEGESNEPIPEDAYGFIRFVNGKNRTQISSAILDEYMKDKRYWEIRKVFHDNEALRQSLEGGASINLPPRVKPRKKKPAPAQKPPFIPPLSSDLRKPLDEKSKSWSPEDIR